MEDFGKYYKQLNHEQRAAVDTIEGPVLVIAGPGTGKTQLLSLRIVNILQKTDTLPQNILCLTFTESAAATMRTRLARFIGQDAYSINIYTYHALGGEIIRRYPEYFEDFRAEQPIDDIGKFALLETIIAQLDYRNPLKQTQYHLHDLISTISDIKRALLTPRQIRSVADKNAQDETRLNALLNKHLGSFTRMSSKVDTALSSGFLALLHDSSSNTSNSTNPPTLLQLFVADLSHAIELAQETGKTTHLTRWKNSWLAKDKNNALVINTSLSTKRLHALADVFSAYQQALKNRGLYDFDDMIITVVDALKNNADLRYSLQEQYLYLLLDEFQDTNQAQLELVHLLTNNPVSEGSPNILAVGDDDQAIYAFQGAEVSNMRSFYSAYKETSVINLTLNYRSHAHILHVAHNIANQIQTRLHHSFEHIEKTLEAASKQLPNNAQIERHEFRGHIGEYSWIAASIKRLVDTGVPASEIAVLAPKHKYLEALVPYLIEKDIPVAYERRENILHHPLTQVLYKITKLINAVSENRIPEASALWPEVLSFDFWNISPQAIWQINWQVATKNSNWGVAALAHEETKNTAAFLLALSKNAQLHSLETILDQIIGLEPVTIHTASDTTYTSPFRAYYLDKDIHKNQHAHEFYDAVTHLTIIRQKMRDHQKFRQQLLYVRDFVEFYDTHIAAGQSITNTSPYQQRTDSVQLMTVFKAKGMEFAYVFLPFCHDDVWGESSRSQSNRLTLPPNMQYIRPAGTTTDERLRLLFVAITRAKHALYLTSHAESLNGKPTKPLSYLQEKTDNDGHILTPLLPEDSRKVHQPSNEPMPRIQDILHDWHDTHTNSLTNTTLRELVAEHLHTYQLSPTHLNTFTDLLYGGPQSFFLYTLLRFPVAPSTASIFGSCTHSALEWAQKYATTHKNAPSAKDVVRYFEKQLTTNLLPEHETQLLLTRGKQALETLFSSHQSLFSADNVAEHNFKNEGVFIDDAHMTGKIDLLIVDKAARTIEIIDYKTGTSYTTWKPDAKLHKYRQQLYCYKLLVENSHSFKGYRVTGARLLFVEPNEEGSISELLLTFDPQEETEIKKLIQAVWEHIQKLSLPDIDAFPASLRGIIDFESALISKKL